MWNDNLMQLHKKNDFAEFLENSLKIDHFPKLLLFCNSYQRLSSISNRYRFTYTYFNKKQHWTIIRHYVWEKLEKRIQRGDENLSDFCSFSLQFLLKNQYLKWIMEDKTLK